MQEFVPYGLVCVEVALANGILCARCVALARKTFVFFTSLVYKSPHSLSCFHRGKTGELTNPCPRRKKKGSSIIIIIINIYIYRVNCFGKRGSGGYVLHVSLSNHLVSKCLSFYDHFGFSNKIDL